jgi:hypothetical protein
MERIDEQLSVTAYLRASNRTPDGIAWLIVSCASALSLLDIWLGTDLIPLRNAQDIGKAATLLVFSPLLVFLYLVRFRQYIFINYGFSVWFRTSLCLMVFFMINF